MAKQNKKAQQTTSRNYWQYLVPGIIIIATLFVYNPSMDNGILHGWDDTEYLTDEGLKTFDLGEIFSTYHLGMYQPVAVTSMALNYARAEEGPKAFHATNLFLHIINILLLWLFVLALSKNRMIAGIVAFLFAMHPMNVESVAWISARSTLLFTAFYLGGLLTYLRYAEEKKKLYFLLTLLFAILALFTKSLAISFPFALFIIDYHRGRKWNMKLWLEKLPFIALSVIFGIIAVDAASTFGHITELQQDYSVLNRFFILCHTYVFYLAKLLVPIELSSIYGYPELVGNALPWTYYVSAIIPILLVYLVYRFWNKQREIIAGLLFFSFAIAPALPLFWSRVFVAADRYAYLSFIGLFLILGILIKRLLSDNLFAKDSIRWAFISVFSLFGIFLMYSTYHQCKYWLDGDVLLSRAVQLSESGPEKTMSHFYLGNYKQNMGENKYTNGQAQQNENMIKNSFIYFRDAISNYDSVLKYDSNYMMAYSNRAMIYGTLSVQDDKYWEMSREDFNKAITLNPEYADNFYNKGWLFFMRGDTKSACILWHKADELGSVVAKQTLEQYCK